MTLRELFERFDRYNQQYRRPRTAEFYRDQLKRLVARFGDFVAGDLRLEHVFEFRATWHFVMAVQRLYRWATEEQDLLAVNPVVKLKRPRIGSRKRVLTRADVLRVLRAARGDFRRFLLACRETAARPQEVREMLWSDVHFAERCEHWFDELRAGRAYFQLAEFKASERRKDSSALRVIPISPRLGRLLVRLARSRHASDVIFLTADGRPWDRNNVNCRMKRLRKRSPVAAKIRGEGFSVYTLRHSAATELAAHGMQTSTLQLLLGHSNIKTTQRYVHVSREQLMDAWRKHHEKRK